MLRQLVRTFLAAALIFSIGLHWVVLQSAAWTGMMIQYSLSEGSVLEGISQTFDNLHPCTLCGAVRQGMNEDERQQKDAKNQTGKAKFLLAWVEIASVGVKPPCHTGLMAFSCFTWAGREAGPPPGPPPRHGEIISPLG